MNPNLVEISNLLVVVLPIVGAGIAAYVRLDAQIAALTAHNKALSQENQNLSTQIVALKDENIELRRQVNELYERLAGTKNLLL